MVTHTFYVGPILGTASGIQFEGMRARPMRMRSLRSVATVGVVIGFRIVNLETTARKEAAGKILDDDC